MGAPAGSDRRRHALLCDRGGAVARSGHRLAPHGAAAAGAAPTRSDLALGDLARAARAARGAPGSARARADDRVRATPALLRGSLSVGARRPPAAGAPGGRPAVVRPRVHRVVALPAAVRPPGPPAGRGDGAGRGDTRAASLAGAAPPPPGGED